MARRKKGEDLAQDPTAMAISESATEEQERGGIVNPHSTVLVRKPLGASFLTARVASTKENLAVWKKDGYEVVEGSEE